MIISHKLKCIYIKNAQVAGTSFEIALSKYCGEDDVITPITEEDEAIRQSLGFCSPRNYKEPHKKKSKFRNHITTAEIKSLVLPEIWDNYLKIVTIRCPYSMYVSLYYNRVSKWKQKGIAEKTFEQFVSEVDLALKRIYGLHIEGKIVADFLIRYEHLAEDINMLEEKIACPGLLETFSNIHAKGGFRPREGTTINEMYDKYPQAKSKIDQRCRVAADKYEFFQKYWPEYKAKLEEDIAKYQASVSRNETHRVPLSK